MKNVLVVLCSCPSEEVAAALARSLVEQRLAACVNVVPGVRSIYRWQGAVEEANEVVLLCKTTTERFEALRSYLRQVHPYDVPEILGVRSTELDAAYAGWLEQSVQES